MAVSFTPERIVFTFEEKRERAGIALFIGLFALMVSLGMHFASSVQSNHIIAGYIVGALFLLLSFFTVISSFRRIELCPVPGLVLLRFMSFLGSYKVCTYSMEEFSSVHSVVDLSEKYPKNYVELVSKSKDRRLRLAMFDYATSEQDVFSVIEDPEAINLRQRIARDCSLIDGGFIGCRWSALSEMPMSKVLPDHDRRDSTLPA